MARRPSRWVRRSSWPAGGPQRLELAPIPHCRCPEFWSRTGGGLTWLRHWGGGSAGCVKRATLYQREHLNVVGVDEIGEPTESVADLVEVSFARAWVLQLVLERDTDGSHGCTDFII